MRIIAVIITALLLAGCSQGAQDSIVSREDTPASDLAEYIADSHAIIERLSMGDLASQITFENRGDPAVVDLLEEQRAAFGDAFEAIYALEPPAEARDLHQTMLQALVTCEEAFFAGAQVMSGAGGADLASDTARLFEKCAGLFQDAGVDVEALR